MGTTRIAVVIVTLAAISVATAAQQTPNQSQTNSGQPNQNQATTQSNQNQNTNHPQNQSAQPQPKKSIWQKVRDAAQQGQNTTQQGQNTVQQMTQPGQNGAQQVQNGMQGAQQGMQNVQGVAQPGQASGAFSGGGGGAGACGQSCFDAGPFQANVSQMMVSQEGAWHVIRMNFQFHNSSNQPLVIAYHDGSMVMVDNNGNAYIPAGGNPGELQGMGIDRGNQTDPQFVLAPGQTGNAMFSVARNRPNTSPIGTSYSYNLTIDELQTQNGALAIPVRTYNLNFPTLAPGPSSAAFSSGSSPVNGVATGNGYVRGTTQPNNLQRVSGQPAAVSPQSQRTPNATPASVVNNAAYKTPVPAAKPANAPATVRPAAATTRTTTPPKKTTPDTTTPTAK